MTQHPKRRETDEQAEKRARDLLQKEVNQPEPIEVPLNGIRPALNRAERRQVGKLTLEQECEMRC